jgi:hypothetical protein
VTAAFAAFTLFGLGVMPASAQRATESEIKAAYIYNFAKFVGWPESTFAKPNAPIRFCVLNDQLFEADLGRIVTSKSVLGHSIAVTGIRDGDQFRECHVLFISALQKKEIKRITSELHGTSVLTVGETAGFLEQGGMINFVVQDDRVQFEVNHKAAEQAGLYVSSRLLGLANRVLE